MSVRWCIFPGCQFYTADGLEGLEAHAVAEHGAESESGLMKSAMRRVELRQAQKQMQPLFEMEVDHERQ